MTDFAVSQVGGYGPTTGIAAVDVVSATTVQITLNHAIAPGTWTRITHTASGAGVCVGYLPGDVSGDGVVTASDIAALIDSLNCPYRLFRTPCQQTTYGLTPSKPQLRSPT